MARRPGAPRTRKGNVTWPLTPEGVENIQGNFDILFKDLNLTAGAPLLTLLRADTLEATPVRGDLIVARIPAGEIAAKWDRFPIGEENTVLRTSGVDPEWAKVHLTTDVDEILPVANGGTNVGSYTAGSIVFAGAGGTSLIEDNANLFYDDTNNRIGIGTNAPTVRVDVVQSALGTTLTPSLRLANLTAATSGSTRQVSPALVFSGQAWDTDGAGASKTVRQAWYLKPVSGTVPQSGVFIAVDQDGAGTFTDEFVIGTIAVGDSPRFGIRDGNLLFRNAGRGISFVAAVGGRDRHQFFYFWGCVGRKQTDQVHGEPRVRVHRRQQLRRRRRRRADDGLSWL
jgi:hypothetical protein